MQNSSFAGGNVDIGQLENTIEIVMGGDTQNPNYQSLHKYLVDFQESEDSWTYFDKLIDNTTSSKAKFLGIKLLLDFVKYRWGTIDPESQQYIKDFVCQHTFDWSHDPQIEPYLMNQIDLIMVELIIAEWPQEWPDIVDDLITSASTEPGICQNNLKIISMLSQQVFDFGQQEITSFRIAQVSAALYDISLSVFDLVNQVLTSSDDFNVISKSLEAFRYIVKWLDPQYIFETDILSDICDSFLINPEYQPYVLSIIGEATSKPNLPNEYTKIFPDIFELMIQALQQTISDSNIEDLYMEQPDVIKSIIFFLSSFLSANCGIIEEAEKLESLYSALSWVVEIMNVDDFDSFRSCCELWGSLIRHFFLEKNAATFDFYNEFFPTVRRIMIARMERPIEILIVENDDGSFEKEVTKNSAQVDHYNTMKDCLVLLANISGEDTVQAISEKIDELHENWSYQTLNSVCWSSGAISGTLSYQDEKQFIIMVLRELIQFSSYEEASTEDKAMIASGIMFVCSSYPRFLMAHPSFLNVIENKLFDFMQNEFPGIKEMAVESFTRIAEKCKSKFLISETNGQPAFIDYLIVSFDGITSNLSEELKAEMIKAMAIIISACGDDGQKSNLTKKLMNDMNQKWVFQTNNFSSDDFNCLKNVLFILRCNMYVAGNVGMAYHIQFQEIFDSIIEMYGICCSVCSGMIEEGGENNALTDTFRICSQIKSTIIQIIIKFASSTTNVGIIRNTILPQLTMNILEEYEACNPYCRIPELLSLMEIIITKVGEQSIGQFLAQIMAQLFKPSVDLICDDYDLFMEFRLPLTNFMKSVVKSAFVSFTELSEEAIVMMENTIEWGCQHPNVDICKENIELLLSLFTTVESKASQAFKNQFNDSFYLQAIDTMFGVMTDTVHKFAFSEQCKFLKKLFSMQIELKNVETLAGLLAEKFPSRDYSFFCGFFDYIIFQVKSQNEFVSTLRDFLVEVKHISRDDLFAEENMEARKSQEQFYQQEIPGMAGPAPVNDIDFDDDNDFLE